MRGFGKSRPRVKGRDEEAHDKNRRVELVVIRHPTPGDPPASATAEVYGRPTHAQPPPPAARPDPPPLTRPDPPLPVRSDPPPAARPDPRRPRAPPHPRRSQGRANPPSRPPPERPTAQQTNQATPP